MRAASILLFVVAAPCLAAACSSTPPPGTTPASSAAPTSSAGSTRAPEASSAAAADEEVPRGELAARLIGAICEASAPCCAATGAAHEPADCAARAAKLGWNDRVAEAKHYDGKAAARCLADVRPLAAKCEAAEDDVLAIPSCAATFAGTAKTGEPCESDSDCALPARGTAFCWTGLSGEDPGRCAASVPPERGAACFSPLGKEEKKQLVFSECSEDPALRCDPATNTCGPRVSPGGPCEVHNECGEGALCLDRKCTPRAGARCASSSDCAVGQACTDGTCGPGKKLGETCSGLADCADGMCATNTRRCSTWAAIFLCKAP